MTKEQLKKRRTDLESEYIRARFDLDELAKRSETVSNLVNQLQGRIMEIDNILGQYKKKRGK